MSFILERVLSPRWRKQWQDELRANWVCTSSLLLCTHLAAFTPYPLDCLFSPCLCLWHLSTSCLPAGLSLVIIAVR